MSAKCIVGYEVSRKAHKLRSVVFTSKKVAKKFQKANGPHAQLQVVKLCEGKIVRRGKRTFHDGW